MKDRIVDRQPVAISIVVKGKNEDGFVWTESGTIISVSPVGAGFYLQHQCRPGQALSLLVPLPRRLRRYDKTRELYRVWGLVQHCNSISTDDFSGYHIGVAFVGKETPSGYNENSQQSYRICGMGADGLWKIEQASASFIARKFERFRQSLEVTLSFFDEQKNSMINEDSSTLDISRGGAAVFSNLPVSVGGNIKFKSKNPDFRVQTIVRRCSTEAVSPILHLEFIGAEFPVESIRFEDDPQNNVEPKITSDENAKPEQVLNIAEEILITNEKIPAFADLDSILEISDLETSPEDIEIEVFDLVLPKENAEAKIDAPEVLPETETLSEAESLPENIKPEDLPPAPKKLKNRKARKKAEREAKKKTNNPKQSKTT